MSRMSRGESIAHEAGKVAERHRIATAIRDLTHLTACYPPEIRDVLTTIAGRVERGEL